MDYLRSKAVPVAAVLFLAAGCATGTPIAERVDITDEGVIELPDGSSIDLEFFDVGVDCDFVTAYYAAGKHAIADIQVDCPPEPRP